MKILIDHHYYIDEFKSLERFIETLFEQIKNKRIKYIYNLGGYSCSASSYSDRVYMLSDYNYIVFDDDTVIKFCYDFFSMLDIYYTNIKCLTNEELLDLENEKELCCLDLNYIDSIIIDYEIESFSDEYIINPCDDTTRPSGGDYFKEIVLYLSNGQKLCICAEIAELDGYCNIWMENNSLKGIFNSPSHKVWWKD